MFSISTFNMRGDILMEYRIKFNDKNYLSKNIIRKSVKFKFINFLIDYNNTYLKSFTENMNEEELLLFQAMLSCNSNHQEIYIKCLNGELPSKWIYNFSPYALKNEFSKSYHKLNKEMLLKLEENINKMNIDFSRLYQNACLNVQYYAESYKKFEKYSEMVDHVPTKSIIDTTKSVSENYSLGSIICQMASYGDGDPKVHMMNQIINEIKNTDEISGLFLQLEMNQIDNRTLMESKFPRIERYRKYYKKSGSYEMRNVYRDYCFVLLVFEKLYEDKVKKQNLYVISEFKKEGLNYVV